MRAFLFWIFFFLVAKIDTPLPWKCHSGPIIGTDIIHLIFFFVRSDCLAVAIRRELSLGFPVTRHVTGSHSIFNTTLMGMWIQLCPENVILHIITSIRDAIRLCTQKKKKKKKNSSRMVRYFLHACSTITIMFGVERKGKKLRRNFRQKKKKNI